MNACTFFKFNRYKIFINACHHQSVRNLSGTVPKFSRSVRKGAIEDPLGDTAPKLGKVYRQTYEDDHGDVFGIESDVGVICIKDRHTNYDKFKDLLIKRKPDYDVVSYTSFGYIRRDSDNKPDYYNQTRFVPEQFENEVDRGGYRGRRPRYETTSEDARNEGLEEVNTEFDENNTFVSLLSEGGYIEDQYFESEVREESVKYVNNPAIGSEAHRGAPLDITKENVSCVDDRYIEVDENVQSPYNNNSLLVSDTEISDATSHVKSLGYIDDQYFVTEAQSDESFPPLINKSSTQSSIQDKELSDTVKLDELDKHVEPSIQHSNVDEQYFSEIIDDKSSKVDTYGQKLEKLDSEESAKYNDISRTQVKLLSTVTKLEEQEKVENVHSVDLDVRSEDVDIKKHSEQLLEEICNVPADEEVAMQSSESEKPEKAFDYVLELRKKTRTRTTYVVDGKLKILDDEKLDEKGFRILKYQVPDLSSLTRDELLLVLKNRVVYSNDDVVIIDKPYNLVIHDASSNKVPSLSSFLDDLAHILDPGSPNAQLHTVHRLDKDTTGCLILARNEAAAQHMKSLFAQRKVTKIYWIVTTKIPDPMEGIIDIPIAEGFIDKRSRMVLNPQIPRGVYYKPHCKHGKNAITHYRVLATSGSAALVEAMPETGIKHQLRVHFGFGLNCPILGDHKYSHLDKLAPQKLPGDMLQRLGVRQAKVRDIPMHIHAKSIVVPQFVDGRNLFAFAPLPEHMAKNLRRLKFRKK